MKKLKMSILSSIAVLLISCNAGTSLNSPSIANESVPFVGGTLGMKEISNQKISDDGHIRSPKFTKDGKYLFVTHFHEIRTFLVGDGLKSFRQVAKKSEKDNQNAITLSPDNKYLFSATSTGWINKYKVNSNGSLAYIGHDITYHRSNDGDNDGVNRAIKVAPDGKYLFVAGDWSDVMYSWYSSLWSFRIDGSNLVDKYRIFSNDPNGKSHKIVSLDISPNGQYLYAATLLKDTPIYIYKLNNLGQPSYIAMSTYYKAVYSSLALSPDGTKLYAASSSGSYIIKYNVESNGSLGFSGGEYTNATLQGMTLDPSGAYLVGTDGAYLRVYELGAESSSAIESNLINNKESF